MMLRPTGITISFGASSEGEGSRPVVARIMGFANEGREAVRYDLAVPAGESVEQELPHGLYNVEVTLPSGRIIQRNVTIDEDTNETYRFFDDFAQADDFSLQESVGRSDDIILADAAISSGNTSKVDHDAAVARADEVARTALRTRSLKSSSRNFGGQGRPPDVSPPQTANLYYRIGAFDWDEPDLPVAPDWTMIEPDRRAGDSALWRISPDGNASHQATHRHWVRIELPNGRIELASLPLPWFCSSNNEYSPADLLVDPSRSIASTTVAVRDRRMSGLLAFLDRGQASAAAPLLAELEKDDLIEEMIFAKMVNPLAACAAAYVGLAVYPPDAHERWDAWLGNCMHRFPDIPDAAIVHARRLILRPSGPDDNDQAAEALRAACKAGIPYFSAGLLLLREMLALLGPDYEDLKPLADTAAGLVARVDPGQAFTVLRYSPSKEAVP